MNLIKFPTTKEHRKDLADIYAHFATNLIEVILKDECTKEEMNKHMKKAMIRIGYNEKMVDEMLTEIEMEVSDGTILFWPSYLRHGYYETQRDARLTLSFNCFPKKFNSLYSTSTY